MIYLNNASTSYPKPDKVIKAVDKQFENIVTDSHRSNLSNIDDDVITSCRKKLANFFNVKDHNQIIFTLNATEALNQAIIGLSNLKTDKNHIITTSTEHNSVLRPLHYLEQNNINVTYVQSNKKGFIDPDDIKKEITNKTLAIVVNHCSNVIGTLQDIYTISLIAKENNVLFIVDASQSAGLVPINVENIDFLAFTGHKSLFGPQGTGGFYINKNLNLFPLKTGGTGSKSDLLYQPYDMPSYYESGTHNTHGIAGLNAGVEFVIQTGLEKIEAKEKFLFETLLNELKQNNNVEIYGYENGGKTSCSMLSFNIKGIKSFDAGYILENSFEIIVRTGLHCAPLIHKNMNSFPYGTIRASWTFLTDIDSIYELAEAIKTISNAKDRFL